MGITSHVDERGIAEVVMDNPPVNALTVAGWFELAHVLRRLGDDQAVRVVVRAVREPALDQQQGLSMPALPAR